VKRKSRVILWLLFIVACCLAFWWLGQGRGPESRKFRGLVQYATARYTDPDVVPGSLLVDLKNDADDQVIRTLAATTGLRFEAFRFSQDERIYRARGLRGAALDRALAALRRSPEVEAAEREVIYAIPPLDEERARLAAPASAPAGGPTPGAPDDEAAWKGFPNDPQYRYQWHLRQIHMPAAWKLNQGDGVVVAVIDTGVKRVSDLAGVELVAGHNFVAKDDHFEDDHGHGTHVAGTIAQATNNGVGVAGIAFHAKIMPLKVLSRTGSGTVGDIADAIRYAADHGAQVINMSLGGRFPSKVLAKAVKYAHDKGVVVVCAAGNDGRGRVSYPAAYPGAIAVAATQYDETTTFYSNWGKEIDVAAPGGNVRVDQNGDGKPDGVLQNTLVPGDPTKDDYFFYMGTSMASPHVAGVAALVVASGVTQPDAVEKILKESARHPKQVKWDEHYGAGIVDAQAALTKTEVAYGGYQLGLGVLLAGLLLVRLRRRGLAIPVGAGFAAALVLGSSGLFVLPALGLGQVPVLGLLGHGFPSWDAAVLGAGGHGNALFFSVLAPALLAGLLYGVRRLRPALAGFALGVGAHLLFHLFWNLADIRYVPNVLYLDQLWLALNALLSVAVAYVVVRR
jgi:serine protease